MKNRPSWPGVLTAVVAAAAIVAFFLWLGPGKYGEETLQMMRMEPLQK